ncbi:cytochrome P450 family protein [Actinoalloteichus sp. GBA129-24]|uniref:cytochrome P450 family protein n=1 Tax=Actinoalloteichus sp. GBA129-24 TaxID=1612551 RepID=UPI000951533C|nr:cytochrome P450 [Actinoalloteichus sp. GBA129-24]
MVAWSVNSHDHLRKLLSDPRVSKDPNQHWPGYAEGKVVLSSVLTTWVGVKNMFNAYGDDHKRLRSLVSKAFTARRVNALQPWIESITERLIAELAAGPQDTPVDLREGFCFPVPIEVICALFGVPEEHRPELRRVVDGVFDTAATPEEAMALGEDLYKLMGAFVADKRANPGDDLASALINARDEDGSRLDEIELLDTLALVLSAGHETTVNLLDQAITALLTYPDQFELVRSGERSWDDVIDETMRWQAPVANLPLRYAVEDIQIGDILIRKGDRILAAYAATGRDPERHGADADQFDLTRAAKDHLAFGHGVHYCLGAPLARMEVKTALPALFARFPNMRLAVPADELVPMSSFISNGHHELPVILNPGSAG